VDEPVAIGGFVVILVALGSLGFVALRGPLRR